MLCLSGQGGGQGVISGSARVGILGNVWCVWSAMQAPSNDACCWHEVMRRVCCGRHSDRIGICRKGIARMFGAWRSRQVRSRGGGGLC